MSFILIHNQWHNDLLPLHFMATFETKENQVCMFWFTLAFFSLVLNVVTDMQNNFINSREIILAGINDWAKKIKFDQVLMLKSSTFRSKFVFPGTYCPFFVNTYSWKKKCFVRTQLWTKFTLKSCPCEKAAKIFLPFSLFVLKWNFLTILH